MGSQFAIVSRVTARMPAPRTQSHAAISQCVKRGPAVIGLIASLLLLFATVPPASADGNLARGSGQVDALRLGRAQSPVLDRLDAKLNIHETRRGEANTTDPGKYDLLIVDGDANSRQLLSSSPLLDRFTNAGDPVIALDVKAAEREALFKYTDFEAGTGTPGEGGYQRSELFMYEIGMIRGTPTTQIIDSGPLRPSGQDVGDRREKKLRHDYARGLANDAALLVEGGELSKLRAPATEAPSSATCTPEPCPELQDWHIEYQTPSAPRALGDGHYTGEGRHCYYSIKCPAIGAQQSKWTLVHDFDVYLNNKPGQPQKQIIEYTLDDGSYSPTNPLLTQTQGDFFLMYKTFHLKSFLINKDVALERGWWTGYADVGVRPTPARVVNVKSSCTYRPAGGQGACGFNEKFEDYPETDSRLQIRKSYPDTTNNLASTTSGGDSYDVGVTGGISKDGPSLQAGFTYHVQYPSQTTNDPDWGVQNLTAGNSANWRFSARNNCNVDTYAGDFNTSNTGCWDRYAVSALGGDVKGYIPKLPNQTSTGATKINTRARWETRSLVNASNPDLAFMINTPVTVADTFCDPGGGAAFDGGNICDAVGGTRRTREGGPEPLQISQTSCDPCGVGAVKTAGGTMVKFPAGNVIPVGIKDFSVPDKADASQDKVVTAKVTLNKPAPLPVQVAVYSDDNHAQVSPPGPNFPASRGVIDIAKGCEGAIPNPSKDCKESSPGTLDINIKPGSPGESATALISAAYGNITTKRLQITTPKAPPGP